MNGYPKTAPDGAEDVRARFESAAPVILVDPDPVVRRGRRRRATARVGTAIAALAAVLAVVLVPGLRDGSTAPATGTAPPPAEPERPVAIQVVPGVVPPGDVVAAVLVASAPNDLTFGVAAELDRWDGSAWRPAGVAGLCVDWWGCVGTVTDRLGPVEDIGLGASPGAAGPTLLLSTEGLTDGWYRLVQRAALDDGVATGVFEVRAGAPAAPPLPSADDARLAVEPMLVPLGGGPARVVTQVPAGEDGALTVEAVEEVDSALDRSALIQRWDGEQWLDVADVPVRERAAGLGVEQGSPVVLPALEEGSYRLVRTRADAPALWGVFTVTAAAPALEQVEPAPGS